MKAILSFALLPLLFALNVNAVDVDGNKSSLVNLPVVVSINSADVEQLMHLKGIGQKRAQEIVRYRQLNGPFKTIDDLLLVKGVGEKVLVDNRAVIVIN